MAIQNSIGAYARSSSLREIDSSSTQTARVHEGSGFADVLTDAVASARNEEVAAADAATAFAKGEIGVHEVMIAQERASIALRYAVTLKNRALEAYKELMNTQI